MGKLSTIGSYQSQAHRSAEWKVQATSACRYFHAMQRWLQRFEPHIYDYAAGVESKLCQRVLKLLLLDKFLHWGIVNCVASAGVQHYAAQSWFALLYRSQYGLPICVVCQAHKSVVRQYPKSFG